MGIQTVFKKKYRTQRGTKCMYLTRKLNRCRCEKRYVCKLIGCLHADYGQTAADVRMRTPGCPQRLSRNIPLFFNASQIPRATEHRYEIFSRSNTIYYIISCSFNRIIS